MKQQIKGQIRQMAREMYPTQEAGPIGIVQQTAAMYGAAAVIQRLDIDEEKLHNIFFDIANNIIGSPDEAKQEILNAITLK